MKYLISTIIPFYNSEKYLKESIESVLNQSIGFDSIQLILINDGSTDNSKKIATYFSNRYKNIKYFYQRNQGVGLASNKGLQNATGKYVTFLGSDDILDKNAYQILYHNAEKHNAEISMGKMILFDNKEKWCLKSHSSIFLNSRLSHIKNELGLIFNASPANKIFNLNFVKNNNITYSNLRSHADAPFVIPLLFLSNKCYISYKSVYYWRQDSNNSQQITKNYNRIESIKDLNKSTKIINNFLESNDLRKYLISINLKNYHIYQKIIRQSFKDKNNNLIVKCYKDFLDNINYKHFQMLPKLKKFEILAFQKSHIYLAYFIMLIYKSLFGSFDIYKLLKEKENV